MLTAWRGGTTGTSLIDATSSSRRLSGSSSVSLSSLPLICTQRPSIALVTPLPPDQTGVADYLTDLLPHLQKHFDIDLYVASPDAASTPSLRDTYRIYAAGELTSSRERYTAIVYQFGNSPFHTHMVDLIEACPGIAVMHDFFLSNIAFDLAARGF